ncbi:MAG: RNA polymerase sigma factor [Planctomycetota bacterium]
MEPSARFHGWVLQFSPRLLGVVLRFVKNRAIAEELVQDVWLRAWRERNRIDEHRDAFNYLRVAAVHRAIDYLRSSAAIKYETTNATVETESSAAPEVSGNIEFDLSTLSAMERAAILLYYQEGQSVLEISKLLSAPPNTIKTWLSRARAKLKKNLLTKKEVAS